jgi:hypothetical protein
MLFPFRLFGEPIDTRDPEVTNESPPATAPFVSFVLVLFRLSRNRPPHGILPRTRSLEIGD